MMSEMTVSQFRARLDAGEKFYLLDVRQPEEHRLVALPGSTLIPLNQLVARAGEIHCPEGVPLVVYCHHGVRSRMAAQALAQMGHAEVYSLAGGIDAWSLEIDAAVPRY